MREGDFSEFAAAQSPALRRLAYAVSGRWDRADDLVQGTFERAYSRWPAVSRADDPGAYVRRILLNLAVSESRRPWRRHELAMDGGSETSDLLGDAHSDTSEQVGQRLDLARALAGLTVKQRAVVMLRFYEDRSVQEVAAILGVAEGTVKRQTSDALGHLRSLLPDHAGRSAGSTPDPDAQAQQREVPHA